LIILRRLRNQRARLLEVDMGRKSKAIVVSEHKEIDGKESDELIEKYFKKLMRKTKTERYKYV